MHDISMHTWTLGPEVYSWSLEPSNNATKFKCRNLKSTRFRQVALPKSVTLFLVKCGPQSLSEDKARGRRIVNLLLVVYYVLLEFPY